MQFQLKTLLRFVSCAAVSFFAVSALPAMAQSAGDTLVNVGWFHIAPQDSSDPLKVTSPLSRTIPGSGATVQSADTAGVVLTRFLTDNWAMSLDIGLPPRHKLDGSGTIASVGQLGSAKQWSPALLAKYYFGDANSAFRPLLGLGVSRIWYTDVQLTDHFQQYMTRAFGGTTGSTSVSLSKAWAPVFNAGATYALDKNWHVMFTVSYLPFKTTADLTTKTNNPLLPTVKSTTSVKINPLVTYLSVGYRF